MTATDELVSVRYMVDDVDEAIAFYTDNFEFELGLNASPAFAEVVRGRLRLLLAGPRSSAGRPMPDGRKPTRPEMPLRSRDSARRTMITAATLRAFVISQSRTLPSCRFAQSRETSSTLRAPGPHASRLFSGSACSFAARFAAFVSSFLRLRSAFVSAAFSLASTYDWETSFLPPVQPKTEQTSRIAATWFQAVTISCWAVE